MGRKGKRKEIIKKDNRSCCKQKSLWKNPKALVFNMRKSAVGGGVEPPRGS
jgi:hypothetical protein